ncbi:MAG: hypothetical protein HFJ58_05860 [Clostridia bacterium]|nr:hypothetical protein [Clostridia bacterium]
MKRFFVILLVMLLLVGMCACSQKEEYSEEEQIIIDALYSLKADGASMQQQYNEWDEEKQDLMLSATEVLYNANAREYETTMALLKTTSVVIPDDLPETLPDFQK